MNKAILMSIQPAWLVKILNGDKTIGIRKTMPKCELPIDVYFYCKKDTKLQWVIDCLPVAWGQGERNERLLDKTMNGKVVAKFTLNYVTTCLNTDCGNEEILKNACLTKQKLDDYVGKRKFFAWHIDNLVIFDKPMELSEFVIFKKQSVYCYREFQPYNDTIWIEKIWVGHNLYKAPQSWQYVYVKGE